MLPRRYIVPQVGIVKEVLAARVRPCMRLHSTAGHSVYLERSTISTCARIRDRFHTTGGESAVLSVTIVLTALTRSLLITTPVSYHPGTGSLELVLSTAALY